MYLGRWRSTSIRNEDFDRKLKKSTSKILVRLRSKDSRLKIKIWEEVNKIIEKRTIETIKPRNRKIGENKRRNLKEIRGKSKVYFRQDASRIWAIIETKWKRVVE